MNINSEKCELLAKISKLSRINGYFETEIIRYQMIVKYYEKLFKIFENIRNKFDFNENYNNFEEILLKRKLNELKTIKPLDIDMNKDLITVKPNKQLIIETESDVDINDNNFDTNSVNSDETENNSQLNVGKRVDTSVGKTLEEPQNQTNESNNRKTSEVKTLNVLKTYGKINRILVKGKYEDIVDTNTFQSLRQKVNAKRDIQLDSDLLDEDIEQENGKINDDLEIKLEIKSESMDGSPDESVSNVDSLVNEENSNERNETNPEYSQDMRKHVYRCSTTGCKQIFDNVEEFKAHVKTHIQFETGVAQCNYNGCDRKYYGWKRNPHLRAHQVLKHPEMFPDLPFYHCKVDGCKYKAKRNSFVTMHMKNHTTHEFFCELENCSKFFHCEKRLIAHYREHELLKDPKNINPNARPHSSANRKLRDLVKRFICETEGCDKAFYQLYALNKHTYFQHNTDKSCEYCGKKFKSYKLFSKHLETHYEFITTNGWTPKSTVSREKRNASNSHICEYCGKSFVQYLKLVVHRKTHKQNDDNIDNNDSNDSLSDTAALSVEKLYCCDICNKGFHWPQQVRDHKAINHSNEKPFKCEHSGCGKSFKNDKILKQHARILHKQTNRQVCEWPECDFQTFYKRAFDDHISRHKGVTYACDWPECDYTGLTREMLRYHKERHRNPEYRRKSKTNERKLESDETIAESVDTSGLKVTNNDPIINCDQNGCDKSYTNLRALRCHQLSRHPELFPNKRSFHCTYSGCNYKTTVRRDYVRHSNRHQSRPFNCKVENCDHFYKSENSLMIHMRDNHGMDLNKLVIESCGINADKLEGKRLIKTVACDWPDCSRKFYEKQALKAHMISHTGDKPFVCPWPGCERSFGYRVSYTMHVRTQHKQEMRFHCEWPGCEYKANYRSRITCHMNVHKGEKKYQCDYPNCQYKANNIHTVNSHKKTHKKHELLAKGVDNNVFKKYVCDWEGCNKRFLTALCRVDHMNVHTGQRPHKCDYNGCGMSFAHRKTLKVHKQTHTKEYRFVCDWPECGYKTYFKACFETHKVKHTGK